MASFRGWAGVAVAVARAPGLWPTVVRQARRVAPPGWWRRAPFLPVPSGEYLRFRSVTQYGDPSHRLAPDDVLDYLRWCRRWDRLVNG
jgi:hypothetical protein